MTDIDTHTSTDTRIDTDTNIDTVTPADTTESVPRQRYELDETGFMEVPKRWRRFYRHWQGAGDTLAPNEVICPVCKVVIRSTRELRPGDRVYCMPCMSRLIVVVGDHGRLEADVVH